MNPSGGGLKVRKKYLKPELTKYKPLREITMAVKCTASTCTVGFNVGKLPPPGVYTYEDEV